MGREGMSAILYLNFLTWWHLGLGEHPLSLVTVGDSFDFVLSGLSWMETPWMLKIL